MTAFRSNLEFVPSQGDSIEAGRPLPAFQRSGASSFRLAAVALSLDSPESDVARRHSVDAAVALLTQAEARDPRLAQLLRPDPADPGPVTWTVACYQIGDLSPSALRDFPDAFEAVRAVARCPEAPHVAAELIASTGSGLRWTAMIRTGETVRFQLLSASTGSDSASPDQRGLDKAKARWAAQLARWAIEPDEPDAVTAPLPAVPGQLELRGALPAESAVVFGQILEAVRGLSERIGALESRVADLQLQLGLTSVLSAERYSRPDLLPTMPLTPQLLAACRRAGNQSLALARDRGRAVMARWRTNASIPRP